MTKYGKANLLAMLGVPLFAAVASVVVFGVRGDTQVFVFGTNLLPMLIGGLFSALLLRAAHKSSNHRFGIALTPTLLPAAVGVVWYLLGMLNRSAGDAGREFFAGPLYLVMIALAAGVIATIVYLVAPSANQRQPN